MQKVTIEPFHFIGIAVKTSNINGQAAKDIGELWGKFVGGNIAAQIPNKVDETVYCFYTDFEGDYTQPYTTVLGCKVKNLDQVPQNMYAQSSEGGNYLKTFVKGDIMQGVVGNKWVEIWGMDLQRTYTTDFEVYGEKARNPNDAEIDILIAVQ